MSPGAEAETSYRISRGPVPGYVSCRHYTGRAHRLSKLSLPSLPFHGHLRLLLPRSDGPIASSPLEPRVKYDSFLWQASARRPDSTGIRPRLNVISFASRDPGPRWGPLSSPNDLLRGRSLGLCLSLSFSRDSS